MLDETDQLLPSSTKPRRTENLINDILYYSLLPISFLSLFYISIITRIGQGISNYYSPVFKLYSKSSHILHRLIPLLFIKFLESFSSYIYSVIGVLYVTSHFDYTDSRSAIIFGSIGAVTELFSLIFGSILIDSYGPATSLLMSLLLKFVTRSILFIFISNEYISIWLCFFCLNPLATSLMKPTIPILIKKQNEENSIDSIDQCRKFHENEDILTKESNFLKNEKDSYLPHHCPITMSMSFILFYLFINLSYLISAPLVDFINVFSLQILGIFGKISSVEHHSSFHPESVSIFFLIGAVVSFLNLMICYLNFNLLNRHSSQRSNSINLSKYISHPFRAISHGFYRSINILSSQSFWRYCLFIFLFIAIRAIYRQLDLTFPKYFIRDVEHVRHGSHSDPVYFASVLSLNPFFVICSVILLLPLLIERQNSPSSLLVWVLLGGLISAIAPLLMWSGSLISNHHHGISSEQILYVSAIFFMALISIGESLWSPKLYEYTLLIAPKNNEATFLSLTSIPLLILYFGSGLLSGKLLDEYCPDSQVSTCGSIWVIISAMGLVAMLLLFALRKCYS